MSETENDNYVGLRGTGHSKCNQLMTVGFNGLMFDSTANVITVRHNILITNDCILACRHALQLTTVATETNYRPTGTEVG